MLLLPTGAAAPSSFLGAILLSSLTCVCLVALLRAVSLQLNVWDGFQGETPDLVAGMEMLPGHLCWVDSASSGASGMVCTA